MTKGNGSYYGVIWGLISFWRGQVRRMVETLNLCLLVSCLLFGVWFYSSQGSEQRDPMFPFLLMLSANVREWCVERDN